MGEGRYDDLVRDLATLGRGIDPPVPSEGLTTAVMDRVAALPSPTGRLTRGPGCGVGPDAGWRTSSSPDAAGSHWWSARSCFALLATPPVRAAVADWFGFGGVRVERGPSEPSAAQPPPEVTQDWSVSEAAAAVDFTLSVPEELGDPDGVEVSPDRRLVSMSWATDEDGVVRLDQFDARFDFSVLKRAPGVFYAAVGGTDALWFEEPHEVVLLEPDGSRRTESARLAGHTLIWLDDVTTLRLEGDLSLERAVEIAESSVTVD